MLFIACFLVAMLVAVLAIPVLIRFAAPLGLMDIPNARKVHLKKIPRIGGIAIVIGSLLPIMIWSELDRPVQAYVLGALCLLCFGIWDDRKELNYKLKFLGQIIAVAIFVFYGEVTIQWLPFQGLNTVPIWIGLVITFLALLGITNAVNLVDGLDGLAGGTSLLSLGAVAVIAFMAGDTQLVMLTMAVMGGVFGFLRYNTHPASIFMGDTGSQFLGFSIGVICVLMTQQSNTALSPVLPLILLGLPILDTLTVMTRRILNGRSPFSADKNHFHHRLMKLGFKHYEAVIAIYMVQLGLIVLGFALKYQSDWILLLLFLAFCFGFNGLFHYAESTQWRFGNTNLQGKISPYLSSEAFRRYRTGVSGLIRPFVFISLPIYLMVCIWGARHVEGMLPIFLGMALMSCVLLVSPLRSRLSWLNRLVWYTSCGLAVYCSAQTGYIDTIWVQLYILLLAISVLLSFILEQDETFSINPLDVIVLVFAGLAFYLSGVSTTFSQLGIQVTQAVLFLYAVELMLNGKVLHLTVASAALSAIFSVSGLTLLLHT